MLFPTIGEAGVRAVTFMSLSATAITASGDALSTGGGCRRFLVIDNAFL
jgi:hypothetical protein